MAGELAGLVSRAGAAVTSAPAMRELPRPSAPNAGRFGDELLAGKVDGVLFLTGVGARALLAAVEPTHGREPVIEALRKVAVVVRGPKPAAVMREWGVKPIIEVPEPNTWREVLAALDTRWPVAGKRVAVQEYGEPNERLLGGLRDRGAEVLPVAVYAWAMPEDIGPLQAAVRQIAEGRADVLLFTTGQQARHLVEVARGMGLEGAMHQGLGGTLIGSIGPTCSETLRELKLGVDFEPDRVKMSHFVRELSRCAGLLLARKRSTRDAGVEASHYRRVDVVWPAEMPSGPAALQDSPFMRACRREPVPYTPVWLMRQAGRYQREYRDIRSRVSFLELCHTPELAAEVTLMAVDQLGVDAAIIFADILLILEPMGAGVSFNKGEGPSIGRPVREARDVDALLEVDPAALSFVYEAVRMTRRALKPDVPLIGFAGAPFTVASYLVEGGSSRNFVQAKGLMYRDPGAWNALMERLVRATVGYLNAQIAAGAQVIQLFDSWVGCLSAEDYRQYVQPHSRALIAGITPGVPVIHFGADSGHLLRDMRAAGGDVIGLDWRTGLADGWAIIGHDKAVQGNLDPVTLFATPSVIEQRARAILDQAAGRPGHIFNLGHGILPETPVDHVMALVDAVHECELRTAN